MIIEVKQREELFQPNNHSFSVGYKPIAPDTANMLAGLLFSHYPALSVDVNTFVQVGAAEQASNNFRVSAVLKNSFSHTFILQRHNAVAREAEIVFIGNTLRHLLEKGVSVPRLVPAQSGLLYALWDGSIWQLYEYIEGDHYRGTFEELIAAAHGLALFHKILQEFPYGDALRARQSILPPFDADMLYKILVEANVRDTTEVDTLFIVQQDFLKTTADDIIKKRASFIHARCQAIHGDLHPHNMLFAHLKLKAILDFGMMQFSELLRDVSFAAHRFARQYAVYQGGDHRAAQAGFSLFLNEYRKYNFLTPEELQNVSLFIKDELMRRIVHDFSSLYFEGTENFANVAELKKKIMLLKEADFLYYE
ncbi:MAG TPA: hypothetical protein DDW36_01060 [Candidatus Magasanikbacteria bacterium]|nr:hypothetical protein [Candidatus Magasanikbacteria bacterium]